ncbi:MAG: tetratricopeptide repeat protein [Candidatus Solibacter sp.]
MSPAPLRRKRKTNSRSALRKYWWLVPVLAGVGFIFYTATGPKWSRARIDKPNGRPITGYVADFQKMSQEYARFYGRPLNNPEIEKGFEMANKGVLAKDYNNAIGFLEQVVKVAAIPLVFNNLGVLYAEMNDKSRAINAFREALARDLDYQPVRLNLERLKDVMALGADPVNRELEPNNSPELSNLMVPGKAVDGDIEASVNDIDFFRITTPPAPRDMIQIEITNRSTKLAPVLKIFDSDRRVTDWTKIVREPGASLAMTLAPPPNSTLYLQVSGYGSSAGAYSLIMRPFRAYDTFEPNDDIFNAPRIELGKSIGGGIMDAEDTDYFSFVSPRTGTVHFTLTNRSTTLIPALSTFSPDRRSSGFGPDVHTPGLNLRHTIEVQGNQTYFIQIWSQGNTTGDYSFIVE